MGELANDRNGPEVISGDRFALLWRRIKEHRIAQWTVGYVAVAYGIQHAVTLTSEAFKWPDGVIRISMLLLALGLPVAMTLAWYHGERASRRISGGELAVVSVVLLGISFAFYLFVRPEADVAVQAPTADASIAAASPGGTALAVLPLANVSGDKDQEFFSDGMTDEIMSALAKVTALRVVGRESAFEFKGKSQNDRAIGRALGARYLVEGSVRKAGQRVRITAQLVRAEDGVSLWTENYDRDLTDIFAVQEDVARAIAASLQIPLGLQRGERLVSSRTKDDASYEDYLRAKALVRARSVDEAIAILESLVARDPNFAPAWALLSTAYRYVVIYDPTVQNGSVEDARRVVQRALGKGEMAARKAIQLDTRQTGGYVALGSIQYARGKWADAEDLLRQASALDPSDPEALFEYGVMLARVGRLKESLVLMQRLRTLEPFVPIYNVVTASIMQLNGQSAGSIPILEGIPVDSPASYFRNARLAEAYAAAGRYAESADTLSAIRGQLVNRQVVEAAARLIRSAPATAVPREKLPALGNLDFVYAYVGAQDRQLDHLEHDFQIGRGLGDGGWDPLLTSVRKTERFKELMRKAGLVDYWRARGWPDLCRPATGDDFVCN